MNKEKNRLGRMVGNNNKVTILMRKLVLYVSGVVRNCDSNHIINIKECHIEFKAP